MLTVTENAVLADLVLINEGLNLPSKAAFIFGASNVN